MMTRFAFPEGVFNISPVPGQDQLAHCHGFFVPAGQRGQGKGTELKQMQMTLLRAGGYDYATCTIDSSNEAQRRILEGQGWKRLDTFPNSKTASVTELWGCKINQGA